MIQLGFLNQYAKVYSTNDLGSFDFSVQGTDGILEFYPVKYIVNDYNVSLILYNVKGVLSGVSSANYGGIVNIVGTSVSSVSVGSTCTIVSIANTYTSAKVLVEISASNGQYEFDELNIIHDGSNIQFLEYGQLTNNSVFPYSSSGLGTYNPYFSGSNLIVDFIPNTGLAVTCNTLHISIANTSYTGVGTFDMKYSLLEARTTSIASSISPIATPVGQYINVNSDNFDYDCAHFLVQVSDNTNNNHQLSEIALIDDDTNVYATEYGIINTLSGLGTIGAQRTSSVVELTFTPLPNIGVDVKVYLNALRCEDDDKDILDFLNSEIQTTCEDYEGTESSIKRAFNISHKNSPIFEKYFIGSASTVVNTTSDVIYLPNHFFVTGEKVKYSNSTAGAGSTNAIGIATTSFVGVGTTSKLPDDVFIVKVDINNVKLARSAEDALKFIPKVLDITSVGIGTLHKFVATNQNAKVIVALDNLIQSPIVSTAITTTLATNVFTTDNLVFFNQITSFFGGDLIKIGNEIMRIDSVGIGSPQMLF
jgi:hypothetical protein